jgi:hypothetical protein
MFSPNASMFSPNANGVGVRRERTRGEPLITRTPLAWRLNVSTRPRGVWKRKKLRTLRSSVNPGSGQGRDRTGDTRIFSPVLYQLSYLAKLEWPRDTGPSSRAGG